jgi:hypothetical protein
MSSGLPIFMRTPQGGPGRGSAWAAPERDAVRRPEPSYVLARAQPRSSAA